MTVQIVLPLRHLAYPGDARFTGEGYRFAWNVLAAEKVGWLQFRVTDRESRRSWLDDATGLLSATQLRVARGEPDLILQIAHLIAAREAAAGRSVEVLAESFLSTNGHPAARLIDPAIDLAALPPGTRPARFLAGSPDQTSAPTALPTNRRKGSAGRTRAA